jgi:uncharacterized lipoprotein
MKKLIISSFLLAMLAACGSEPKPTPQEQKAVEDQVAKDQAAMDSMERVIQQQIESVTDDSLMETDH